LARAQEDKYCDAMYTLYGNQNDSYVHYRLFE
jgi:hypothetical protein